MQDGQKGRGPGQGSRRQEEGHGLGDEVERRRAVARTRGAPRSDTPAPRPQCAPDGRMSRARGLSGQDLWEQGGQRGRGALLKAPGPHAGRRHSVESPFSAIVSEATAIALVAAVGEPPRPLRHEGQKSKKEKVNTPLGAPSCSSTWAWEKAAALGEGHRGSRRGDAGRLGGRAWVCVHPRFSAPGPSCPRGPGG